MNTTPTPSLETPLAITLQGGTITEVTTILQNALQIAALFPAAAPVAAIGGLLLQIIGAAVQRIQTETGKPIDLSKIPFEAPLP